MKQKTNEELLNALMKANKVRREAMAKKAGYASVESYRQFLSRKTADKNSMSAEKPSIHIVNILDISSSMSDGKFDKAWAGIQNEIKELQTDENAKYFTTLVTFSFSNMIKTHYLGNPLNKVPYVNVSPYGMTALNQAVGETLEKLIASKGDEKIVVSIFTDGAENASTGKYSQPSSVAEIIQKAEKAGITVTFIGTDQDTKDVIMNFNIDASNTLVHNNTAESVEKSFKSKLSSTIMYSANVVAGVSDQELLTGFYKQTGTL